MGQELISSVIIGILLLSLSQCGTCKCVCLDECTTCICVQARGQTQTSSSIDLCFTFWGKISHCTGTYRLASLEGQWVTWIFPSLPPSAERIGTQPFPGFPMGTRDPNSSSYTCAAGNLLMESSPQPQCWFFFLKFIFFNCTCKCFVCTHVCAPLARNTHRGQRRTLDFLELDL